MKKNLLLIVPMLHLGGQERICVKTAELLKDDYNVIIIIFDKSNSVYQTDCEVVDLNTPAQDGKLKKLLNVFRRVWYAKRIRRERKADYVYSFGTTANLVNVLSRGVGKTIIGLRGYSHVNTNTYLNQYIYKHCDSIIGCAEEICRPIRKMGALYDSKTRCLYNPLDLDFVLKKGQELVEDYSFTPHTIISHGRLDEIKNWPRLIKAFSLIKREVLDAQLLIIGEGEQRAQLQQLIDSYSLYDSVTLIGFRQNPFAYISKSALYVLPSYSEGFPNSLVEGMVFLPVISTDCKSGPREILSSGSIDHIAKGVEVADYGLLVEPASDSTFQSSLNKEDELLAEAILDVLQNSGLALKMKIAAKKRATDFSCEKYKRQIISILEKDA